MGPFGASFKNYGKNSNELEAYKALLLTVGATSYSRALELTHVT